MEYHFCQKSRYASLAGSNGIFWARHNDPVGVGWLSSPCFGFCPTQSSSCRVSMSSLPTSLLTFKQFAPGEERGVGSVSPLGGGSGVQWSSPFVHSALFLFYLPTYTHPGLRDRARASHKWNNSLGYKLSEPLPSDSFPRQPGALPRWFGRSSFWPVLRRS